MLSFCSAIVSPGSATAVLVTVSSTAEVRKPVIVTVAKAAGPVPSDPMSQSMSPPVGEPTSTQTPCVVVKPVMVKMEGTVSTMRTKAAPTGPTFLTSMV